MFTAPSILNDKEIESLPYSLFFYMTLVENEVGLFVCLFICAYVFDLLYPILKVEKGIFHKIVCRYLLRKVYIIFDMKTYWKSFLKGGLYHFVSKKLRNTGQTLVKY